MAAGTTKGIARFIAVLLLVYTVKQLIIAFVSPPFTGHDEVEHFAGIRILAKQHRMPTLWADTLPPDLYAYRAFTIEWHDRDRSPLYTAVHPPLYYGLMAPIYRAAARRTPEEIQYVLRCASIPFGIVTVAIALLITRALFPGDAFLAVTVPTVVAFQPQVSYEAAMVNNDALATAAYSVLLYALVIAVRDGPTGRRAAGLGALAGVALLAKGTAIVSLLLIPAALWSFARPGRPPWADLRRFARHVAIAFALVLIVAGPWWWFMTQTYGDPMGFAGMAATQPDLTRGDATFLQLLFSGRFLVDRWNETWGEFGWRLIHISAALVSLLAVVCAVCMAGVWTAAVRPQRVDAETTWRIHALTLLALACVLAYLGVVQFGVRFVLTQARYFFPVVDAAALLAMLGLRTWIPGAWRAPAQAIVVFAAVAVNVMIYTAYVVPYWYFR